jgi:hypothetical protein
MEDGGQVQEGVQAEGSAPRLPRPQGDCERTQQHTEEGCCTGLSGPEEKEGREKSHFLLLSLAVLRIRYPVPFQIRDQV